MSVFTKMTKQQIDRILRQYPQLPAGKYVCKKTICGTVNTYYKIIFSQQQTYYLKIDEVGDALRLKNELLILNLLHHNNRTQDFITPCPLPTIKGKLFLKHQGKYILLFPEIPGMPRFTRITKEHLFQIGQCLAQLHKIKAPAKLKPHRFNKTSFSIILKQIKKPIINNNNK